MSTPEHQKKERINKIAENAANTLIIMTCVVVAFFLIARFFYALFHADWTYVVWLGIAIILATLVVLLQRWLKK